MNLDEFITNNRNLLDSEEPDDGHEDRFRARLGHLKKKTAPMKTMKLLFRVASIFLVIASLSFLAYKYTGINESAVSQKMALSQVSDEYKEVEEYYQKTIDKKLTRLENLRCENSIEQKKSVYDDLKELDTMYSDLQNELVHNANDERIINAMINSYQMKANVIDKVLAHAEPNCQ